MSTKIYNAYLFHGEVEELLPILKEYRKLWLEAYGQVFIDRIESRFNKSRDKSSLSDKELRIECTEKINAEMEEQGRKRYPALIDLYHMGAEAAIYFHDGKIVVQFFNYSVFAEVNKIFAQVITEDKFTDYHYQDQSDPYYCFEEGLSDEEINELEKEYEERKNFFDFVFEQEYLPLHAGLQYVICGDSTDIGMMTYKLFEYCREKNNEKSS